MENVNIFDIVIITLITLLGLKGLVRGFTKEFFGLVGIVGGVFVSSRVAADTGNIINDIIPLGDNNTILLVGFILSLVIFWIVAYIIGATVSKVFSLSGLGIFDKLLGFTFGASKIFLLFSIIVYAATNVKTINDNIKPKVENSIVFPILVETGNYIVKLDTKEIQEKVKVTLEDVVNSTKDTIKDISDKEITKEIKEKLNKEN